MCDEATQFREEGIIQIAMLKMVYLCVNGMQTLTQKRLHYGQKTGRKVNF
jgi:hypothetical protein